MELVRTNSVLLVVQLSEAGKSRREVKTAIAAEISCHAAGCRCLGAAGRGNPAGFLCPISIVCRLGSCEDRARVNRPIPPHAPRSRAHRPRDRVIGLTGRSRSAWLAPKRWSPVRRWGCRLHSMSRPSALWFFLNTYALLYGAFGMQSPFVPALLREPGLQAQDIGLVLAAAMIVRVFAGPVVAHAADRLRRHTLILCGCALFAALASISYLLTRGLAGLLCVALLHAAMLGPIAPISDALAATAAQASRRWRAAGRPTRPDWQARSGRAPRCWFLAAQPRCYCQTLRRADLRPPIPA